MQKQSVLLPSTGDGAVGDFFPMGDVPWPCFPVIHHCRWIQWTISRASLCVSCKLLSPWKVAGCVWSLEGEGRGEKERWRVRLWQRGCGERAMWLASPDSLSDIPLWRMDEVSAPSSFRDLRGKHPYKQHCPTAPTATTLSKATRPP